MIRAIYTPDIAHGRCPVFEYDEETKHFHMMEDRQLSYPFGVVMNDTSFQTFVVGGDGLCYQVENKQRVEEDQIHLTFANDENHPRIKEEIMHV